MRDSLNAVERIRAEKRALRRQYKEIRASIAPEIKCENDRRMAALLEESLCVRYAKRILLYASFGSEPDTLAFAEKALNGGKRLYFPKSYPGGVMRFFEVKSLAELCPGAFGVLEPREDRANAYEPGVGADVCLVPGVCFDVYGYRIGYGKGYYDRFLSRFDGVTVGLAYADCLCAEPLAHEKRYDKYVDFILTEGGITPRVRS